MRVTVPPTLDDVAMTAGVSRSTASRAINGGLRVSPEAQAAVDDAVARLGYSPNRAGMSLLRMCTRWPRAASALPSSVAMMPLPPIDA